MTELRVRRAVADDALLVGALHLQFAREQGMDSESGFLDRFANRWLAERHDRPTWIAERAGEHAGVLETRRVRALPWPGRPDVSWLHVGLLFVRADHRRAGVGRGLVEAMTLWARETDVRWVRLNAPEQDVRAFWRAVGFTSPNRLLELDLR